MEWLSSNNPLHKHVYTCIHCISPVSGKLIVQYLNFSVHVHVCSTCIVPITETQYDNAKCVYYELLIELHGILLYCSTCACITDTCINNISFHP